MRARRSMRRQSWRFCSLQEVAFASLLLSGLLFLLLRLSPDGGLGRRRSREEKLVGELQRGLSSFELYLQQRAHSSTPPSLVRSDVRHRGIVICAGGATLLANVYVSVKVLRDLLKTSLPIQIYHNGPKEASPQMKALFSEFRDLEFIDFNDLAFPQHHIKPSLFSGYVQKIFSLYSTSFEQVLLLDADSQPLKDPALLFESSSFRETGSLFWSDFWNEGFSESPEEIVYKWIGVAPPWTYKPGWRCAESGQLLFDRKRHGDVLEWLWILNTHAKLLYKHMLGDKDTFEIAFILAGKEEFYNRVRHGPGVPLSKLQRNILHDKFIRRNFVQEEKKRFLRLGMLQFDDSGEASFLHRTERTKFAQKKNGYSLEVMHPEYFVPPLSPETTSQIRWLVWRMHSIPASLADVGGNCSSLDSSALEVVQAAGLLRTGEVQARNLSCADKVGGLPRLPLYPFSALGAQVQAASDVAFTAFQQFSQHLPTSMWYGKRTRLLAI